DVLTEVYGYARARRVIWAGFGGLVFAAVMASVVVALPPAPFWKNQEAYEIAFGSTWRIAAASMFAYFCGEFVNSFVLAKMKILTAGRWLWTRTIGSTIVGEAVDSALFYPLAFYASGILPNEIIPKLMLAQFVLKVSFEVIFTPLTYKIVGALKRAENEDYYDRETRFTPFTLKVWELDLFVLKIFAARRGVSHAVATFFCNPDTIRTSALLQRGHYRSAYFLQGGRK